MRHARSPEGRVAAKRAASAPPPRMSDEEGQGKHPSMPSRAVLKEEGTVPPMPLGAFVKEEEIPRQAPSSNIKEEVVVKREHGARVDRRRGSASGRTIIVLYKKGCHFSGGSGHRPAHLSSAIWPLHNTLDIELLIVSAVCIFFTHTCWHGETRKSSLKRLNLTVSVCRSSDKKSTARKVNIVRSLQKS